MSICINICIYMQEKFVYVEICMCVMYKKNKSYNDWYLSRHNEQRKREGKKCADILDR